MKYQAGDDIIVLHSKEEGKVVEVINDKMVLIEIRGVRFPAYVDQIDFPYFHRFTQKKVVEEKKPHQKKYIDEIPKERKFQKANIKTEDGVWLSLLPKFSFDEYDDEIVELIKIYLVNKTDKSYKLKYKQELKGEAAFEISSEVLAHHDFYLHDIPFENLNDNPNLIFEFSLLQPNKKKAPFFSIELKLKAKQVFKRIEEIKEKNEPTISYSLFTNYPDKAPIEKTDLSKLVSKGYKIYDAAEITKHLEPARTIIDLHIEKLADDYSKMAPSEILTLQLKEFEKWFVLAVAHRQQNLIVIHGIGTGKLREEIHEMLKQKKEVKTFINQYDHRFGYGATEIIFQY
ncbi:MAG: Smr/MutS family protein [Parafilimonas sp.]